tara:strand:- start:203 stop:832 length:630 start_codon:yes stop_codon:yes gene_type:complete
MKNFLLKYKVIYRLYQNIIRKKNNEYNFIKYIFQQHKNINVLDICCGDSFILDYIKNYINNYIGIDNNRNYLKNSKKKFPKFSFIYSDIERINKIKKLNQSKINFIFINGAIHHLSDSKVTNLISYLNKNFPNAKFLFIDPLRGENKFINKLMINLDRGKYIRTKKKYKKILKNFSRMETNDFFIMSFLLIFHFKKINLKKYYIQWKTK